MDQKIIDIDLDIMNLTKGLPDSFDSGYIYLRATPDGDNLDVSCVVDGTIETIATMIYELISSNENSAIGVMVAVSSFLKEGKFTSKEIKEFLET